MHHGCLGLDFGDLRDCSNLVGGEIPDGVVRCHLSSFGWLDSFRSLW